MVSATHSLFENTEPVCSERNRLASVKA